MTKTIRGAIDRAEDCVKRNISNEPVDIRAICAWAVGAAFRYVRGEPEPDGYPKIVVTYSDIPGVNSYDTYETIPPQPRDDLRDCSPPNNEGRRICTTCGRLTNGDGGGNIHESGPTALGGPKEVLRAQSKAGGFTGDACSTCGNFTLQRNGTCTVCRTCGSTSGCS